MALKDQKPPQAIVRIDARDKATLDQLAAETGESYPKLLHRAVTQLKKKIFFEKMNRSYKAIKDDAELWTIEQVERNLFDQTSNDGLDREP